MVSARTVMKRQSANEGVALILVLGMLVLLAGLIVAFFSSVTTERAAASVESDRLRAEEIAQSTVNSVIAQVRDATSSSAMGVAWASQPGAIRTYPNPGEPPLVHKLYSADKLREEEETYSPELDSYAPKSADERRFGFVDLNEPAKNRDGQWIFPVIDPRAKRDPDGNAVDPKASPSSANRSLVEGFQCADYVDSSKSNLNVLPLNVKWLYLLKDGTSGTLEQLMSQPDLLKRPSRSNPIIGRTAYWTDDDTSKLNINTASEPTYWDTPYASTLHEIGTVDPGMLQPNATAVSLNLAVSQPVQGEYQRYPGHPATTSLSPVFRSLRPLPTELVAARSDVAYKNLIYQLIPHIYAPPAGGPDASTAAATINQSTSKGVYRILPDDNDRLFASPDELVFQSPRIVNGQQVYANTVLPGLTSQVINRQRFFLTAHSRAPELNLFGRPRIAMWPVPKDEGLRTYFDNAFAFTSTIWPAEADGTKQSSARKPFYFTRVVSADPTLSGSRDATLDFYGRVAILNPPRPSRSGSRNEQLYCYLQQLTDAAVPGFGTSFAQKYGARERDQILTEIFDYIRCTNLMDGTGWKYNVDGSLQSSPFKATRYSVPYDPGSTHANETNKSGNRPNEWSGQVVPTRTDQTSGLGRFVTLTEVGIDFYVPDKREDGTPVTGKTNDGSDTIRAVLLFEFSTASPGYMGLRDTYTFALTQEEPLLVNDVPVFGDPLNTAYCVNEVDSYHGGEGRPHTPCRGFMTCLNTWTGGNGFGFKQFRPWKEVGALERRTFPFISGDIKVSKTAGAKFFMNGGRYRLDLYAGHFDSDPPETAKVQTISFKLAPRAVGLQKPFMTPISGADPKKTDVLFAGRKYAGPTTNDIIRSVELSATPGEVNARGDFRLTSALRVVPEGFFARRQGGQQPGTTDDWTNSDARIVHGFKIGHGDPARFPQNVPIKDPNAKYNKATTARLAPSTTFRSSKPHDLPDGYNGVKRADGGWGDWDRGVSKHPDAPGMNKPDEGNVEFDFSQSGIYPLPYMRGPTSQLVDDTNFSPNRLVPSPVALGSLPTGVKRTQPWQTLLFRPDRPRYRANEPSHPGAASPPDFLWLDLFWMPVVEPYAISEPCSTAGKVNLNFVIAPFGYISGNAGSKYVHRETAMHGVLKGVKLTAFPANIFAGGHSEGNNPKDDTDGGTIANNDPPNRLGPPVRFDIDPIRTLGPVRERFGDSKNGIFRSAAEVCSLDLYPYYSAADAPPGVDVYQGAFKPLKARDWGEFWYINRLTGDNCRERPYAMIYPRVTTQSNTYTTHVRSQAVSIPRRFYKADGQFDWEQFREESTGGGLTSMRDLVNVLSEYRGSVTFERYLDPNDPALAKWTKASANGNKGEYGESLDPYYRYRVIETKRFMP